MTTILGHHIRYIRPAKPRMPIILKKDLPKAKYKCRAKTIKEHSGKVVAVCVKLVSGGIRSLPTPCTHIDVCEKMVEDVNNVVATGWLLENGNYLWR